jgi:hypothetical protein
MSANPDSGNQPAALSYIRFVQKADMAAAAVPVRPKKRNPQPLLWMYRFNPTFRAGNWITGR